MPVNTSVDLEMLIESARLLRRGDLTPRFEEVFVPMMTRLSVANIPYVLTGAMAFGLYAPARATDNIDILTTQEVSSAISTVVAHLGLHSKRSANNSSVFFEPKSGIEIKLWVGEGEPFRSAITVPVQHLIFGVDTKIVRPEYLLWLYCLGTELRHTDLAIQLILAGNVDLVLLREYLWRVEDAAVLRMLDAAVSAAAKYRQSSYIGSVKRRLAKLGPRKNSRAWRIGKP